MKIFNPKSLILNPKNQKGLIKLSKHTLVSYLIVSTIFVGTGLIFLFNPFTSGPKEAQAAWFNDNWAYRKSYTLPTHSALETNVYVTLTIDTSTLVTAGKLQSDCDDIRFTQQNGEILAYYIVSGCNTSTTSINVNFQSYPAGVVNIYFYYGNPSATSGASGSNFSTAASNNSSSTTLNKQVASSSDDAVMVSITNDSGRSVSTSGGMGTVNNGAGDVFSPGSHGSNDEWSAGARFTSITIPQGTTITSATFTITPQATYASSGTVSYHVSAQAADNAATFNSTPGNLNTTARPRSTADCGTWTQSSVTADSAQARTVTSCIQEIINRAGWASGNAIVIIVDTASATTLGEWQDYCSYDYVTSPCNADHTDSPKLDITYGTAFSPTVGSEENGPSPTLYWKFDEGQGTTAEDSTANGLDGTISNGPAYQTENFCISSKCLYFAGTDDNVNKSDDSKLDFVAADNFTVSAWVKRNGAASANTVILQKSGANIGSTYTGYKLYMDASGDFCFAIQDGTNAVDSACTSAVDFDDDSWHFVTGVKAATTSVTLYVDGNQRAQDASIASTGSLANASTFRVGADSDGTSNEWLGFIDEVKVTRDQTARTAAQVAADYNALSNPEGVAQQQGNNNQNMPSTLSNGLIGYWNMDSTSWLDSSGNSVTGTGQGDVTTASGKFNNAGTFDGTGDCVNLGTTVLTNTGSAMTVSAWVNPSSLSSDPAIIRKQSNIWNLHYISGSSAFRFELATSGGSAQVFSGTFSTTGTWYLITGVYDGSYIYIYVNGVYQNRTALTGTINTGSGQQTAIGANISGGTCNQYYWNGKIDEVRVYTRALSAADVSRLYNWAPGPVGYWKFDEGTSTTAYDSSGNGNNGTLTLGPTWGTGKYGNAVDFDGVDSYVDAGTGIVSDKEVSISAWYRSDGTGPGAAHTIISNATAGSNQNYTFELNRSGSTNKLSVVWGDAIILRGNTDIATDKKWHHVAMVRSGSSGAWTIKFYVDGVLDNSGTTATNPNGGASPTTCMGGLKDNVGNPCNLLPMGGLIDDVKVYHYARTPSQIIEDMNAGHPAPGSPVGTPVGWWKFNEGAENTCSGGTNDACNSGNSGSTYDGTSTATRTNAGQSSRALDFDSVDDVVTITNGTAIDMDGALANFTFSAWIYPDSDGEADTGQIFNKGANTYLRVDSQDGSNNLDLECNLDRTTDTNVNVADAFTISTWNYVACSWDGTTMSVYVNGKLRGSSTSGSGSIASDTNNLLIGGGTSNNFDGKIDEFKVYDSALTASQIALDSNQSSTQVLGALSNNAANQAGSTVSSENQEYCIPGDSTSCSVPVGRWDFEEGSGTTAFDISGNANTGTITGATYIPGKVGKGLNLDGVDDQVNAGSGTTLDNLVAQGNSGMTISAWIKPTFTTGIYDTFIAKATSNSPTNGWTIYTTNSNKTLEFDAGFAGNDLVVPSTDNALTANVWQFITVTWTGSGTASTVHMYVNGKEVTYGTTTAGTSTRDSDASASFRVGTADNTADFYKGGIDQVQAFNYVRTPAQIAWDYNRGKPIAYWKFDECQGTTINDSSGNGFSGTWSGTGSGTYTSAGTCTVSSASSAWYNGVVGKKNYSMAFDGTDDLVSIGTNSTIGNLNSNLTVSAWIKPSIVSDGSSHRFFGSSRTSTTNGWSFGLYQAGLIFTTWGVKDYSSTGITLSTNTWYHVTAVMNSSFAVTFYVNGVKYNTVTNGSGASANTDDPIYIGATTAGSSTPTELFSGQLDDIKVFNYALTDNQVQSLYNDGAIRYGPVTGAP